MEDETMLKHVWILTGIFLCGGAMQALAGRPNAATDAALPSKETIEALRARGPEGLEQALRAYDELSKQRDQLSQVYMRTSNTHPAGQKESLAQFQKQLEAIDGQMKSWQPVIDQIGGQRSCTVSRLYWYTDLDKAKAAAEKSGRPILSLRMLGKLTDECSCANSRFFRTALYSNKQVSDFLRSNFVLHWQTVRPVPRVTIDFGDGRKLERTITGNSAHYALASDGTPLDVLPGLYSPLAFQQWLWDLRAFQNAYMKLPVDERSARLKEFHARRRDDLLRRWDIDIRQLGETRSEIVSSRITSALASARLAGQQTPADPAPKAAKAAKRAIGKTAAEAPILRFAGLGGTWIERGMDDEVWQAISNLHRDDVKLDESSIALMRREFPKAAVVMRAAVSKARVEDPLLRLVRSFEDSIALDTVRNEYLLHRRVHELLAASQSGSMDFDRLNEWVYAELFLTPSSDPWLGLARPDVYSALDNDGRVEPSAEAAAATVQAAPQSGG
jgi:hypothetical protein